MSYQIVVNDEDFGHLLADEAGATYNPKCDVNIANTIDGQLAGGVIYTAYYEVSISMHVASLLPRWVTKDMLWICFDYPFRQLKVNTIFGQVKASNAAALEFDKRLGFSEITRIDDVFPDGAMVVLAMKREACRYLDMPQRDVKVAYRRGRDLNGW